MSSFFYKFMFYSFVVLLPVYGLGMAYAQGGEKQRSQDVVEVQRMSMDIASEIAREAVKTCRGIGYQITAVVADRNGHPQVSMRDVYAPEVSYRIAKKKAFTAASFSSDTSAVMENRKGLGDTLNHVDGLLFLPGGLVIETGSSKIIGAVGVSGAPSGDIDRKCAQAGIDAVSERLQFAGM
ncbi:MAG: heme-binding protein [Thiohalorhabdaceae bacterium]